jgi:hypothetical protein
VKFHRPRQDMGWSLPKRNPKEGRGDGDGAPDGADGEEKKCIIA